MRMSRRGRSDVVSNREYPFGHGGVFDIPMRKKMDAAFWMPNVLAGAEMSRRLRMRNEQKPAKPHDVVSNDEYPFGRGGVYKIPMRDDDGA